MLPSGWELKTIGDIAKVASGGTPSRTNESYFNGSIPWVTTTEVQFNVITHTKQKITEAGLKNSAATIFPKGTILMAMYGQGKTRGQIAKLAIDATTNQACAAILLKKNHETEYFYQFLQSQYESIRGLSNSGGQKNLSATLIKSIRVPVPPLAEQTKIAQILSVWDATIAATQQCITNSQQQQKALMQQLLTGKQHLAGFSGAWQEQLLGNICEITTGESNRVDSTTDEGAYTFFDRSQDIRTSNIYLFDCEAVIIAGEGQDFIPKHFVGKFDLHQRTYAVMRFDKIYGRYLFYFMHYFRAYFLSQAVGSTVKSLRLPMFKKMPIRFPSLEEQQKIAALLSTADLEIEALQQQHRLLTQEKKALMQQLLTGKRRVKLNTATRS